MRLRPRSILGRLGSRPSTILVILILHASSGHAFDLQSGWPVVIPDDIVLGPPLVADLDGDGTREIIATSGGAFVENSGVLYVFRFDATSFGVFPLDVGLRAGLGAVADLDGDGRLEIAMPLDAGSPYPSVTIRHTSDGSVLSGWPRPTVSGRPTFADIDGAGNGVPEILVSGIDGVDVYSPTGELQVSLSTGRECPGMQAVADIDGRGDAEIAVGTTRGVYLFDRLGHVLPGWPQGTSSYTGPITLADVDRDGGLDIAAPNQDYGLSLWHADGTLFFTADARAAVFAEVVPHDLDGDGEFELLFIRDFLDHAGVDALHHDGSPVSGWPQHMIGGTGGSGNAYGEPGVTVADLNGDGAAEILAATNRLDTFYIDAWERTGILVPGFPITIGPDHGVAPDGSGQIAVSDLDGDGDVEIIWFGFEQRLSQGIQRTIIYVWDLPGAWSEQASPWPQFHQGPEHRGSRGRAPTSDAGDAVGLPRSRLFAAPNPFHAGAGHFSRVFISGASRPEAPLWVGVEVVDIAGRLVRTLHRRPGESAELELWDGFDDRGRPCASGVFLLRPILASIEARSQGVTAPAIASGRITLLR